MAKCKLCKETVKEVDKYGECAKCWAIGMRKPWYKKEYQATGKNKMTDKTLKGKAISIKGKQYVQVSDRIVYFNDNYPNGCITTHLESKTQATRVVIKAIVIPDVDKPERYFTGYSQAKWGEGMVNITAALENAETSAIGRALASMGIGVLDSVASADEMAKAGVGYKKETTSTLESTTRCETHGVDMVRSKKGTWYHRDPDGVAEGVCFGDRYRKMLENK